MQFSEFKFIVQKKILPIFHISKIYLNYNNFFGTILYLVFKIKPGQLSGQIPTKSCLKMNDGRIPYGAYNQANAKLVTADGDYPSNYEHYSNFEPKKPTGIAHARNPGILKGMSRRMF